MARTDMFMVRYSPLMCDLSKLLYQSCALRRRDLRTACRVLPVGIKASISLRNIFLSFVLFMNSFSKRSMTMTKFCRNWV